MKRIFTFTLCAAFIAVLATAGQAQSAGQPVDHGKHAPASQTTRGPHGGTLRQIADLQIETVADVGGLTLFLYDRAGKPILPTQARGVASLQVRGGAKRYRYDLLPDGQGALMAPVNLSNVAGHQIDVEYQLVGLATADRIAFSEVTTVPASSQQLAAAAIARQKVCPVSGKPLGSMGDPVAVDAGGHTVYVCCAGCVSAVKANPAKYAAGRPQITVAQATAADARLIAQQARCPVMDEPLGSMGHPVKVTIGDKPIFLCCKGCIKKVQAEPAKYLAMVHGGSDTAAAVPGGGEAVREGVYKVTAADVPYIAAQKRCPVMDEPLDAMGGPFKVEADGRAIYICCPGCAKKIAAEPQKYLAVLAQHGVQAPVLR